MAWLKGSNTTIEHNGEKLTVRTLAERHGLTPWTIYQRYRRGDRGTRLTRPAQPRTRASEDVANSASAERNRSAGY